MFKSKWLKRIAILLTVVMVLGSVPVFAEGVVDDFVTIDEVEGIMESEEDLDTEGEELSDLEDDLEKTEDLAKEGDQEEIADPDDSELAEDEEDIQDLEEPVVEMEEEVLLDAATVVWDESIADGFAGGFGTELNPFLISTPAQLAYLAQQVNSGTTYAGEFFRLTQDMNLNERNWIPIGNDSNPFQGSFDGAGHVVQGLYINTSADYQGLFGYASLGEISNLNLLNSMVSGNSNVGAIAGYAYAIANCTNFGSVQGTGDCVGGIAGKVAYALTGCSNSSTVSGKSSVGGITGWFAISSNVGIVNNNWNTGDLTGTSYVGGIVGYTAYAKRIENCVNEGNLNGGNYTGGILGSKLWNSSSNSYITIDNCVNFGNVTGASYSGGIIGKNGYMHVSALASNCENHGDVSGNFEVGGIAGGFGTGLIDSCKNTGEIVTSANQAGGIGGTADNVTNCENWGDVSGSYQIGGIAGKGKSLADCTNYGDINATSSPVGGICGWLELYNGYVRNCVNWGAVTGLSGTVGGIAGSAHATMSGKRVDIEKCINYGPVTSQQKNRVGGLFGYLGLSTLSESANFGSVQGAANVGGILGERHSTVTIDNCYNSGNVTGTSVTGGIAGSVNTLENSYNVGLVQTGGSQTYTIAGSEASIVNSYFLDDTETSTSPYARTSAELKQQSTFEGWDFEDVWAIEEGVSYPKLQWITAISEKQKKANERMVYQAKIRLSNPNATINIIYNSVDLAGNRYTIIECAPSGYYVFHNASGTFVEYSPSASTPFFGPNPVLYLGPGEYYNINGFTLKHIKTEAIMSITDMIKAQEFSQKIHDYYMEDLDEDVLNFINNNVNETIYRGYELVSRADISYGVKYVDNAEFFNVHNQTNFGHITGGYCGYIAANLVLQYWDYREPALGIIDPTVYTASSLQSGDLTRHLYNDIGNSIFGYGKGSWGRQITKVLNKYSEINSIDAESKWLILDISLKNEIDNNRPAILFMAEDDQSTLDMFHAIVVYGYEQVYRPRNNYTYTEFIAHYGWDNYYEVKFKGVPGTISTFKLN